MPRISDIIKKRQCHHLHEAYFSAQETCTQQRNGEKIVSVNSPGSLVIHMGKKLILTSISHHRQKSIGERFTGLNTKAKTIKFLQRN